MRGGLYESPKVFERLTHRTATWRTGTVTLAWHPCAVWHPSYDLNCRQEYNIQNPLYSVCYQTESPPPLAGESTPEQVPRS